MAAGQHNEDHQRRFPDKELLSGCPDVSIVGCNNAQRVTCTTLESIGSDHLSILISTDQKLEAQSVKSLNYRETDCDVYRRICRELFSRDWPEQSLKTDNKLFVKLVLEARKKSTPTTTRKNCLSWWIPECTTAKKRCNKALSVAREDSGNSDKAEA